MKCQVGRQSSNIWAYYEKKLISDIIQQSSVAQMTTDIWTSQATEGYLTLTLHYINHQWEYKNCVLATRETHTGINIVKEISAICDEFKIKHDTITGLVSDNASSIIVCAPELNVPHYRCFGHTLQLSVTGGSVIASQELKIRQKQMHIPENALIIDCVTSWHSTYDMFERLLQQFCSLCCAT
ncbi:hypothetical protein KUTeg_011862 [Tegillarca granosa]|uniref:Transposase n=1 Tax=Tegillarca granosa TaxID=220873 RepID=A0ABQ9EXV8_TEGGR|nr:hypothetical protein KUTeg_011862 [Tegillarca granosa]